MLLVKANFYVTNVYLSVSIFWVTTRSKYLGGAILPFTILSSLPSVAFLFFQKMNTGKIGVSLTGDNLDKTDNWSQV